MSKTWHILTGSTPDISISVSPYSKNVPFQATSPIAATQTSVPKPKQFSYYINNFTVWWQEMHFQFTGSGYYTMWKQLPGRQPGRLA